MPEQTERSTLREYSLLAALTLVAAALRLYRLEQWSFWIDELYSIRRALTQTELSEILARWPPVTTLLTGAVLRQFGVSEWVARVVPAAIGVVSVPALYFPLRGLAGHRTALVAALLLAVSPWHVFWSQNARFYTALMLFYALASLAFFFALEKNRPWLIGAFYALLLVGFRERYLALLLLPVVLTYLLLLIALRFELPPGLNRRMLAPLVLSGVALLLYDAYSHVSVGYSQILAVSILESVEAVGSPVKLGTTIVFAIGIPLTVLALFAGLHGVLQRSRAGLFLLLGAVVPVAVLLAASPLIFTKDRYAFVTLPSWIALGALAVTELLRLARPAHTVLAVGVLAVLLGDASAAHLLYYRANHGNRLDWKGAFATVRDRGHEADALVSWWPEFGPYYAGREIVRWKDLQPDQVIDANRRYWFVLDSETIWGNSRMKDWVERNAELIEVRYLRTPNEAALRVYLYDPARGSPTR